jgi:N-methylhydantoinase A/oxoprolinase/acetone carboxylase beta subunit
MTSIRVTARGLRPSEANGDATVPDGGAGAHAQGDTSSVTSFPNAPTAVRDAWFDRRRMATPVRDGSRVRIGDRLDGPAIIEEHTTTIVVQPGWSALRSLHDAWVLTAR